MSCEQPSGPNYRSEYTVEGRTCPPRPDFKECKVTEEETVVEQPRRRLRDRIKAKMGYYDDDSEFAS